ncbi:protein FAM221A isoform X3 [Cetorhinus maximus]
MSKHIPDFLAQWTVADLGLSGTGVYLDRGLSQPGIVGEDDGGTLFTPEEYERYKKEVLSTRLRNRLFVSWTSPNGIDCKLIGPESQCFCRHRYKQHKTDYKEIPIERPILLPCRVTGCRCISFSYVPLNGTHPIRCRCKHFADDHNEMAPYKCKNCAGCAGFHSSFTCGCSHPTYAHTMIVETKEERLARGRPVGPDVPYAAMGGLTGFNALAEGYMRLDSSGIDSSQNEVPARSLDLLMNCHCVSASRSRDYKLLNNSLSDTAGWQGVDACQVAVQIWHPNLRPCDATVGLARILTSA